MNTTLTLDRIQHELEVILRTTDRYLWTEAETVRYEELSDLESSLLRQGHARRPLF